MKLSVFINNQEFDVPCKITFQDRDYIELPERLNLPIHYCDRAVVKDAIEMNVNELQQVVNTIDTDSGMVSFALDLTESQRYRLIDSI